MNRSSIVCLNASKCFSAMIALHIFRPTERITRVLHGNGMRRESQRTKRVDHHCEFVGPGLADRAFVGSRVRAMRDAVGVNSDRRRFNSAPRHEIAFYVVNDFVGVDVRMVVGRGDGEWVIVEQPWNEGTEHESWTVKGLMHGRWLVDAARYRLEVFDVERKRP